MEAKTDEEVLLPHHVQQKLCTTRLPYRQGRKLTAVKIYTVNDESRHLLIFGVPSLNIRQEAKALFMRFGKLLQFSISKKQETEQFTETYHAVFEKIQSARYAKKMLDTKNFYGGCLHVTYAPELESLTETRQKLLQRRRDIAYRLKKLGETSKFELEKKSEDQQRISEEFEKSNEEIGPKISDRLYMGDINEISVGKQPRDVIKKLKRKYEMPVLEKRFEPCFVDNSSMQGPSDKSLLSNKGSRISIEKPSTVKTDLSDIKVVDCTQTERDVVTNIYEGLNYERFGSENIKKIPTKPLNVLKFNINKNK